ncbi:MAG: hypothetical protein BJ554DRAFT_1506, partial [Olpidium bornovanus]
PDKNDSPQASRRQKLIGVVASVLRDEESRKRYDFFLQNGVPRWRGTGYYYRRHRPGLGSVLIGLAVFVSLLQYLGAWVLCVRRRSMFRDVLAEEAEAALRRMPRRSTKKTLSKGRPADDGAFDPGTPGAALPTAEDLLSEAARDPMNDPVVQFPSPSPRDVLIFQLPRAVFRALLALPGALSGAVRGLFSLGAARRRGKKGGGDSGSDSDDDGRASGARGDADARKRAAGDRPAPSKRQAAAVRRTANRRPGAWSAGPARLRAGPVRKFPGESAGDNRAAGRAAVPAKGFDPLSRFFPVAPPLPPPSLPSLPSASEPQVRTNRPRRKRRRRALKGMDGRGRGTAQRPHRQVPAGNHRPMGARVAGAGPRGARSGHESQGDQVACRGRGPKRTNPRGNLRPITNPVYFFFFKKK